MKKPVPCDENKDPDIFWEPDEEDKYIPETKGFITDMLYTTRGTEIPSLFCIWSAVLILAAAIKREAWLDMGILGKMYANFYIILIGPAGVAKKSTALEIGNKIFKGMPKYIVNPNLRIMKDIKTVSNKGTMEYILNKLLPGSRGWTRKALLNETGAQLVDKHGVKQFYHDTSEGMIFAPELAALLGKEKYNATTTTILTDLFDAREVYEWGSIAHGDKYLKKSLIQFVAGTTVDGFRDSVPQTAKGDGFLSRTILVYVPNPKRIFDLPRHPKNAPTITDLQERLAWITEHTIGRYELDKDAKVWWTRWYREWKQALLSEGKMQTVKSRMDVHLKKLAFILCAQSYSGSKLITKQHLRDAKRLLYGTLKSNPQLIDELETNKNTIARTKVGTYIKNKGDVTRTVCMRNTSFSASEIDSAIHYLKAIGSIRVVKAAKKMNDRYIYIGEGDDA